MVDNGKNRSNARATTEEQDESNQRPPTGADVARLAGVSPTTVSFVLNDVPDSRVTDQTRARVLAAVEELGYIPHASASALATGRSQLVLMPFLSFPDSPVLNVFYNQLAGRLTELGYIVMFHRDRSAHGPDVVRQWASLRPAGLIVEGHRLDDRAIEVLRKAGTKVILPLPSASTDADAARPFEELGICAAEHLIASGHRRLGVLMPSNPEFSSIAVGRLRGVERIAKPQGISVERIDLGFDEQEALAIANKWKRDPHPSGIIAFNDEYAALLMQALLDTGISVPDDVAIIGCDNLPLCELVRPRLTSIWPEPGAAGLNLANWFHDLVLGRTPSLAEIKQVPPKLIVRESG